MANNLNKLATLGAVENLAKRVKDAFVRSVTAGTESGKIKVDGVDVTVCEIASDGEAEAVLDEVFK